VYKYANLNDTLYFNFAVNDTDGSGSSGTLPNVKVRQSGASASAASIYSATPYLLTHADYPQGCYEVAIPATSGNGFITGNEYDIFGTITVSSQNPTGFIGGFKLSPIIANANQILGQTPIEQITSGSLAALNVIVSANSPSGSINYKMYNLATSAEIVNDIDSNSTQLTTLLSRLTALRAGYLDNLSSGTLAQSSDVLTLLNRLSSARAGYLDNLSTGAVALNSDVSTLLTRLSNTRASYLDNLSSGLVATKTLQDTINSKVDLINSATTAIKLISDQINFNGTNVNAHIINTPNDSSGVVSLLNRYLICRNSCRSKW